MESGDQNILIVFDVEGVLIPKARFLLFEVFGEIGLGAFVKGAFFGFLYLIGLISLKDSLKKMYKILEGFSYEQFISLFKKVPLMPGVEEIFKELKDGGFKTALISSSIPKVALQKLSERLGADYVSGPEIGVNEGRLSGEVWGDLIEAGGKAIALEKLLRKERLTTYNCAVVADDRNNLPLFQLCNLRIGYNPDFILCYKVDYVISDLSEIISIIRGEYKIWREGLSKSFILREVIHISGFSLPIICIHLVDRYITAFLIFLVTLLYMISETLRMVGIKLPVISEITSIAAGNSEFQEFVIAPIFYAVGIIMSLIIFPEPIGYASIAVLTFGDGFASIFGRKFGRKYFSFNKNKTIEGSLWGFFFAFMGSLLFIDPQRALISSACGMLAEVLPLPVNDNLAIPLASGLALIALTLI